MEELGELEMINPYVEKLTVECRRRGGGL